MDLKREIKAVLEGVLHLEGRTSKFEDDTPLLGGIPELDSMAVVAMITAIEERFNCTIDDDEIDGSVFATLGSLIDFVRLKIGATSNL